MINVYTILNGTKCFTEGGSQSYLVFQALLKCFDAAKKQQKPVVMAWKSEGLSEESTKLPVTSNNSFKWKTDCFNFHQVLSKIWRKWFRNC